VLARIRGANQRIRASLDSRREFSQILRHLAHVIEQLVDVFRVNVQRLIETRRKARHRRQCTTKLDDRLAHVCPILSDHCIDVIQCLVCFIGGLPEIFEQGLQFLAYLIPLKIVLEIIFLF